ncbi:hypothetical protein [Nitrobacter sp.]|uniref:hypothetical protein n=1 Tax=Nitrobacter sp. TaxID=29420 RepID=UPI001DFE9693|nr:hypothetical protein [Nitrobacter sp.]MCB1394283.1 hypothetical protein [Nitrobacter sp.]MCV0385514.1 hypothetical protein [Nitrobacter sp.]
MILIGIDDTDNLESHGTGYLSRQLGALISASGIARVDEITRHQLLFDRRIPYTSHNSSLCLRVNTLSGDISALADMCRSYLLEHSAAGSDAGLCIATWSEVSPVVEDFGFKAKKEILTQDQAQDLAQREGLFLEGLTGDHGGVIGALASVGLRRSDRDGRIAWRPGLRETRGIVTAAHLLAHSGVDAIRQVHGGEPVDPSDRISVTPWPRSVMIDGRAVLLVEPTGNPNEQCQWQLAPKDILRQY